MCGGRGAGDETRMCVCSSVVALEVAYPPTSNHPTPTCNLQQPLTVTTPVLPWQNVQPLPTPQLQDTEHPLKKNACGRNSTVDLNSDSECDPKKNLKDHAKHIRIELFSA